MKEQVVDDNLTRETTVTPENGVSPPPQFNFNVSTDKMTAYLRVVIYHRDQKVTKDEILSAMKKEGLIYGVDDETIDSFLNGEDYFQEIRVASGKRPVKGEDGDVIFHFNREATGIPKEREDGTVDFKDLDIVQNVHKGDLLCTIVKPGLGIDGIDVYGKVVKAQQGDMPPVPGGESVVLSDDGTKLIANAEGGIHYRSNAILIDDIFHVEDVGVETGNIDFNGSVVVRGMVQEGFSIKAKNDITIRGAVEGAKLYAGGNIDIRIGVNGMRKADIFAEGDVTSGFIENATVKCGGTIYASTVLHSNLRAGNAIKLQGKRGTLIGGTCVAGETISVRTFGSDKNIQQEVAIEPMWYEYEKMGYEETPENPELQIERLQSNFDRLDAASEKLTGELLKLQRPPRSYDTKEHLDEVNAKIRDLLIQKGKINEAMDAVDRELRMVREMYEGHDFRIICLLDCYPGTRITISGVQLRVTKLYRNCTFRAFGGEIVTGEVLPSDKD